MRVVADNPVRGYAKQLVHEITTSDDKGRLTTRYVYEIPDSEATELVKAGKAKVDES